MIEDIATAACLIVFLCFVFSDELIEIIYAFKGIKSDVEEHDGE